MEAVAFNDGARATGNTAILLNVVLDELRKEGIKTELVFPCREAGGSGREEGDDGDVQ